VSAAGPARRRAALGRVAGLALALAGLLGSAPPLHAQQAASAATDAEYVHISRPGDTLIGLGRELLVNPRRWPELARLNAIANPDFIPVGTPLRVPLALMRVEPRPAELLQRRGEVSAPAVLAEGSEVATGADGQAVLRLVDGTLLRLRPDSSVTITDSRAILPTPAGRAAARLGRGRVEVQATPRPAGAPSFRIETPQGVMGVRGTGFRVAAGAADARTVTEVTEGTVGASGRAGGPEQRVEAGFAVVVDADGRVGAPVALLAAPVAEPLPEPVTTPVVPLVLRPLDGAVQYRVQVAADEAFDVLMLELQAPGPQLALPGLPDGDYRLRVRGVDAQGLEGRDTVLPLRLQARPEPPQPQQPEPGARRTGQRAEFRWARGAEAVREAFELARDAGFAQPVHQAVTEATGLVLDGLEPGVYHWRLRSLRADGHAGPWGAARTFELRLPPPAAPEVQVGDTRVALRWQGLASQQHELQIAADEAFTRVVAAPRGTATAFEWPRPTGGRFWARVRAIDSDGHVGPYSPARAIDIARCLLDGHGACVRGGAMPVLAGP
jgi:hypothetical protein